MGRIKAVVYGVGAMNAIITRLMLDKDVEVVGAIARSKEKVGRDLGDVIDLGRTTGIIISDDAPAVLASTKPDIAVIAVNSYLVDASEQLRICAEAGVNVITLSEEALYPWNTAPEITKELDDLARDRGITITGSGFQDTFWVNLVGLLLGSSHTVEKVVGRASFDTDDYGPELAADQQIGKKAADAKAWFEQAERPPSYSRNVLDALVADVGLTPKATSNSTELVIAEAPRFSKALNRDIQPGEVLGLVEADEVETEEGPVFRFEMASRVYGPEDYDLNEWEVKGEPNLFLSNGKVESQLAVCTTLVNRIPDVINAEPGFITMEKLPRLKFRAFGLHTYVNGDR